MKKALTIFFIFVITMQNSFAIDKYSKEYLQNRKHFAIMNPTVESIVEHSIKNTLKKETGGNFKVKFTGYTLSSMKKGIFKYLELSGKNLVVDEIKIPYVFVKTLSDYNYIDYTQEPILFKSDMIFSYELLLSAESLNTALKKPEYQNILKSVNTLAHPLFEVKNVSTKIINNKLYILTEYNFPIAPVSKNKVFVASSDFKVEKGKIRAANVKLDSAYGKISISKIANLLNLLNPLEFTMELLDTKECDANIENINIVDNKVKVDGKIFVKGE